jgi:histidyl-tRNA synthetase
MADKLQAVKGMNDILPDEAELWQRLEETVASCLRSYGYRNLRTPIVEPTALFRRAIGEVTDIVEKEMYSFEDRLNGDALTLRPEATAGIVRACIEHNFLYNGPQRVFSIGPMFRHERPQKGRYRQFHQVDVEALGYAGPDVDAELILLTARIWEDLGLTDVRLEINSLGSPAERALHRQTLVDYFTGHQALLDEDSQRRLQTNPLRILDSKNPAMQELIAGAPRLVDHLGAESRAHFEGVQALLRETSMPYRINPRLVRGLDYYNLTVFEWVTDRLGAQGTVCGGGRYDGLIEQLGGKPLPACGFAFGIERVIALLQETQGAAEAPPYLDAYVVHQGERAALLAFHTAEAMRSAGFDVVLHCGGGNFKAQLKKANASGAEYAVIIGDDEAANGEVTLKALREEQPQQRVAADNVVDQLADLLIGAEEQMPQ